LQIAICNPLIGEPGLVFLRIGKIGHPVVFAEPTSQVDQSAAIAAEGDRFGRGLLKFFFADRTPHCYASFFFFVVEVELFDLLSDFDSDFVSDFDSDEEDFSVLEEPSPEDFSFSAAFLYESLR
jgi:hypothetical protein